MPELAFLLRLAECPSGACRAAIHVVLVGLLGHVERLVTTLAAVGDIAMKKWFVPAVVGIMSLTPTLASAAVYQFNFTSVGAATPLTLTNGPLSVSLTGSGDPGGFEVTPTFFPGTTGDVLFTPGTKGQTYETLTISFNQAIQAFSSFFARDVTSQVGDLVLTAYANGKEVGSASDPGTIPHNGAFSQGTIGFSGGLFNEITLQDSTAPNFAVADLTATYTPGQPLPEPASLSLLGFGLAAIALSRKRLMH